MNKNVVYVVVLAVTCALAGGLVGAGIAKKAAVSARGNEWVYAVEKQELRGEHKRAMLRLALSKNRGKILNALNKKLDLTEAQKVKMHEILAATRQEIEAVGKNVRGEISRIKGNTRDQIMNILTPEQQVKFQELISKVKVNRIQGRLGS